MDRLLVVIALLAPHRELPGGHQHHGRPVFTGERGWGLRESPCLRGRAPVGRMSRLLRRLRGNRHVHLSDQRFRRENR